MKGLECVEDEEVDPNIDFKTECTKTSLYLAKKEKEKKSP